MRRPSRAALMIAVAVSFLVAAPVAGAATPTITTTASPAVAVGGTVTDTALLTGGQSPTGTVTFRLYSNPTCTTEVFNSAVGVVNSAATSAPFTTSAVGTFYWTASYSGDANNTAVATACGDPAEQVIVSKATPALVTLASPSIELGGQISDIASLSGGYLPTGSITFRAFGPGDGTCSRAPAFVSRPVPVNGNGGYSSGPFTPTAIGLYRWIAAYSGDANNQPTVSGCNDASESVLVNPFVGVGSGGVVTGSEGNDVLRGGPSSELIVCGGGDDIVIAGAGDDVIVCGAGNDRIDAGPGRDRVEGGAGNDRMLGGGGRDSLLGGSGRDRLGGNSGNDRASGGAGRDVVGGGPNNDRLNGGTGADRISGDSGRDTLFGDSGADRLFGRSGRDVLRGGSGDDRLEGGSGLDRLIGGPGRDSTRQ